MVSSPVNVIIEGSVPSDICSDNTFLFIYFPANNLASCGGTDVYFSSPLFRLHPPSGSPVPQCSQKWNHRYQNATYLGPQLHLQSMEDLPLLSSRIVSILILHCFCKQNFLVVFMMHSRYFLSVPPDISTS